MKNNKLYTNQDTIHPDLQTIVEKHQTAEFKKPIAKHTHSAFASVYPTLKRSNRLILDSGCGIGDSSVWLARKYPNCFILGLDKSIARLSKNGHYPKSSLNNLMLLRADMFDFWRLLDQYEIKLYKHFIFYPNPWPKKAHYKRRIHGHPVFVYLVNISSYIEMRSNWKLYLEEFSASTYCLTDQIFQVQQFYPCQYVSKFEKKYDQNNLPLYRLLIDLTSA